MGRFLLLLVAASVLTTGAVFVNRGLDARAGGTSLQQNHLSEVVAQRLSETGLTEAAQELSTWSSLPGPLAFSGEMMGGTYHVDLVPDPPDRVIVTSTGTLAGTGRSGGGHQRVAVFELRSSGGGVPAPPAFLAQALMMEKSLTMNQSERVLSMDPSTNANVRTNGGEYVNISERAGIQGFYQSVVPPSQDWQRRKLEKAFVPNSNPEGLDVYQTVDYVEIPPVDARQVMDDLEMREERDWEWTPGQALPQKNVYSRTNVQQNGGNAILDFSGVSSPESPATWVVLGDWNLNGGSNVVIRGHVNVVTTGNINIHGSIRTEQGSTLSLYSERDISINGSSDITGSLMNGNRWGGGNIQLSGSTVIRGPITTRGGINFNGSSRILYTPLSGHMTAPLYESSGGVGGPPRFVAVSVRG